MSYIFKPESKPMLAGGNLRIYNILKDNLKMDASTAREFLAEIDFILNDRFQEMVKYNDAIRKDNNYQIEQVGKQLKKIDHEISIAWGGLTFRILYLIMIVGTPFLIFVLALIERKA